MRFVLDAQLPPAIGPWITERFGVECIHVRDTALRGAQDQAIFAGNRTAATVIVSKDEDFADLVTRLGSPPQVLWVRCGNMTNAPLRLFLSSRLARAIELLVAGEPLIELLP